jgi:hypothetical protein
VAAEGHAQQQHVNQQRQQQRQAGSPVLKAHALARLLTAPCGARRSLRLRHCQSQPRRIRASIPTGPNGPSSSGAHWTPRTEHGPLRPPRYSERAISSFMISLVPP